MKKLKTFLQNFIRKFTNRLPSAAQKLHALQVHQLNEKACLDPKKPNLHGETVPASLEPISLIDYMRNF